MPSKIDEFYTEFYTQDPYWSTPYPNLDEALRFGKICEFLSRIPRSQGIEKRLRILDVGCGRGWLTRFASSYGQCEGVDPVANSVALAREYFPDLSFHVGTFEDLVQIPDLEPYDLVIASEVIEHILDKEQFIRLIARAIVPEGYLIITTPRGEEFAKWKRLGHKGQPIEAWVSSKELPQLVARHNFVPVRHDRVYLDLPKMSLVHRVCASRRLDRALDRIGARFILNGLQYIAGFYQVWLFQMRKPSE